MKMLVKHYDNFLLCENNEIIEKKLRHAILKLNSMFHFASSEYWLWVSIQF